MLSVSVLKILDIVLSLKTIEKKNYLCEFNKFAEKTADWSINTYKFLLTEAALQSCFYEKVFWKYSANLQENTHAEVWFQ